LAVLAGDAFLDSALMHAWTLRGITANTSGFFTFPV
jgi:hypothetical protein